MNLRSRGLIAVLMLAGAASVQGQAQYIEIPGGATCSDVTPDGTRVVGILSSGSVYYWDWQTAPAPVSIGGLQPLSVSVSDDGSVITGLIHDAGIGQDVAAIWTQATGWVGLGALGTTTCGVGGTSTAWDISGDGTMVVGLAFETGCPSRAFKWTQATGMVAMQDLTIGGGSPRNRASRIANDKSIAVGFAQSFDGTFTYDSAATWDPNTNNGVVIDPNAQSECHGVNDDGSIIVGTWYFGSGANLDAFYMTDGVTPIDLGSLNPSGWNGNASDVSDDGSRICGYDVQGLSTQAWMSFQGGNPISMTALLTGLGVAGVPTLGSCESMSSDGTVVVGSGSGTSGAPWLAVIPSSPASNKILPEAGSCAFYNPGSMVALGLPAPGATVTLLQDLLAPTNQATGSTPLLIINVDAPDVNYPCGTLVPGVGNPSGKMELVVSTVNAAFVAYPIPWVGAGDAKVWPLTIPAIPAAIGHKIHVQGAFTPPSFPGKSTLTEGVEMTIGLP